MKFSELEIGAFFKTEGAKNSYKKVSPFGYRDSENIVLGEIQVVGDPEVTKQ